MSCNKVRFRQRSRFGAAWIVGLQLRRGDRHRLRPMAMQLEDRRLPSTFTVTKTTDDGSTGTMGWAISQANSTNGANTINFLASVFSSPEMITLSGTQLELTNTSGTQRIIGPSVGVTINANLQSRVFQVDADVTASLSGLTLTGGLGSPNGGGVYNIGKATLTNCTISGNSTPHEHGVAGGGLQNVGTVNLTECTISNNYGRNGGGLSNVTRGDGDPDRLHHQRQLGRVTLAAWEAKAPKIATRTSDLRRTAPLTTPMPRTRAAACRSALRRP